MNKNYILATSLGIIIGVGATNLYYMNKRHTLSYKDEYEEEPMENKEKVRERYYSEDEEYIEPEKENDDLKTDLEIKVRERYYSEDEEYIENKDEEVKIRSGRYPWGVENEDEDDIFENDEEASDDFVIIDASEFGEYKSYEKESYTYIISTAHLYDSYNFLIEDIQDEIGEEAASMLEENSENEIFLRDDRSKVYIRITKEMF